MNLGGRVDKEELEGVEGGENIIRIYLRKKEKNMKEHWLFFQRTCYDSQHPHGSSKPCETPVPVSTDSFFWYQAHT